MSRTYARSFNGSSEYSFQVAKFMFWSIFAPISDIPYFSQIFLCDASRGCTPPLSRALRLDIEDNYGHPNFTCIYNIKVFGHVLDTENQDQTIDAALWTAVKQFVFFTNSV
jgi:hypothetical protein